MAPGGEPNPSPSASLNLQLDSSYDGQTVSEVHVTLTGTSGASETLTYSGEKVSGINSKAMTTINDPALYDVDGQAPRRAEVEFMFTSGKQASDDIDVRAEAKR